MSVSAIIIRIGIIRFQVDCFGIVFNSTVNIAFYVVSNTAIAIGFSIIGFQFYRCVIVFDSAIKIPFFRKLDRDCYMALQRLV